MEKHTLRYDFTHHVIYSSWELQCDRLNLVIIGHFFPFNPTLLEISFYTCVPMTTIIWDTISEIVWDRQIFLPFWVTFCPFTPLKRSKSTFEKMENAYEDVIILYMCTKNHDHMVFASWDMCNTEFTPLLVPKIKNWKQ